MARSDEIRWQMMGSAILFVFRQGGGKPAAEEKARKYFEGKTGDEIQRMTLDWEPEALEAIAEMLFKDERFN